MLYNSYVSQVKSREIALLHHTLGKSVNYAIMLCKINDFLPTMFHVSLQMFHSVQRHSEV